MSVEPATREVSPIDGRTSRTSHSDDIGLSHLRREIYEPANLDRVMDSLDRHIEEDAAAFARIHNSLGKLEQDIEPIKTLAEDLRSLVRLAEMAKRAVPYILVVYLVVYLIGGGT